MPVDHFCPEELYTLPMITIIDFEASGLESDSYPIQVAWNIGNTVHAHYINPDFVSEWQGWSMVSEGVHGLSREFLREHGEHPVDVAKHMNASLGDRVIYSDAVPFDKNWCERLFDASAIEMRFSFADFWVELAKYAPSGIRGSGHYGMTEWTNMLLMQANKNVGLRAHLADNDVKVRMEIFRLAKDWGFK